MSRTPVPGAGRAGARRRLALPVLLLGAVLALTACGGDDLVPADGGGPTSDAAGSSVVDTPELRALKADAGIEDCPRTSRRGAVEGGLPGVYLECLGGGAPVSLPGLPATPTVINVWATWCGPCRDELPHLARLHAEAGDELAVLGINFRDPDPAGALELAKETGVTYPLVSDPEQSVAKDLGVVGLPQTVFVDAAGEVVATERVPITSYDQLRSLVKEHLGVDLA
ncbi:TlpA family protein disulfide reductase [Mumia zhuanghuii]|uniref:TlpA disulfide reductase family protein n=2 Tax=Mumia TaxID=1546255 RepID=A0ABW1QPI5_9ACTN|nr:MULTISPECIES: TlpA disulfide reductase family protein [Mumia]KAA1425113.1 TlpA family protein disulfide reductase [Mumia zhuanghuii]